MIIYLKQILMSQDNPIYNKIITSLSKEKFLEDFKYNYESNSFIKKFKGGYKELSFNISSSENTVTVCPILSVRFDIIINWFLKYVPIFWIRGIYDVKQSKIYTVSDDNLYFDAKVVDTFMTDNCNFDESYSVFANRLHDIIIHTIGLINNLRDVYDLIVNPILNGTVRIYSWDNFYKFMQLLVVCHIYNQDNYKMLKDMIIEYINYNMSTDIKFKGTQEYPIYYNRLDEIFRDIENFNIPKNELPKCD